MQTRATQNDFDAVINNAITVSVAKIVSKIASKEDADFILDECLITRLRI